MKRLCFADAKTDEEISALSILASEIWREYFPFLLTDGQITYMLDKFLSPKAIKANISEDNYIYQFLYDGKQLVGFTAFKPDNGSLFLSKLYIKKEYRNSGYGRETFEDIIISFAKEQSLENINLTVNKYNLATIAAYEKWGFAKEKSIVTDIGGGYVMDDYVMNYSLNNCFLKK